jgi:hypothetical protein
VDLPGTDRLADQHADLPSIDQHADSHGAAVSAANDTCANPAQIDLQPLSQGKTVSFVVDTANATADYSVWVLKEV